MRDEEMTVTENDSHNIGQSNSFLALLVLVQVAL